MAWPATPLDVEVCLWLAGAWVNITAYVREEQKVTISRGRRQRTGLPVAGRCTMTLDNTDGRFASRYPLGAYYGSIGRNTKLRVRINNGSGYVTRFVGYVPGWAPRWDASERDQTVSITAVGILDRLGRGIDQRSAMYYTLSGTAADGSRPLLYYPAEEARAATHFAPAAAGDAQAVIPDGATPGASTALAGSDPLPTWAVGTVAVFPVPAYASTGQWIARWPVIIPATPPGGAGYLARWSTAGTIVGWSLLLEPGSPDQLALRGYDSTGAEIAAAIVAVDSGDLAGEEGFYGQAFMLAVAVYQSGGNVVGQLTATRVDGLQLAVDSGSVAGTAGPLVGDVVLASVIDDQVQGHLSVVVDAAFDIAAYMVDAAADTASQALSGFAGEMGHERWLRRGIESDVLTTTSATESAAMGPQLSQRLLDDLEDIQATDLGRIVERIDDEGLDYVATSQLLNAAPTITLAYDDGQIRRPWEPQDDQQEYRNDITARRPSGGSYQAVDRAAVEAYDQFPTSVTVNVATDEQLPSVAGWLLHLGIADELVWPAVRPNFYDHLGLLDDWLASDLGDQMWVTGHPSPLAPDTIKLVIEGYTEVFGSYLLDVTVITSPGTPYVVGEMDDDLSSMDTAGCELTTAETTSSTTWLVHTIEGPTWASDAADRVESWMVAGEKVDVASIVFATPTYVAAGTVAHADNASVTPGLPVGIQAGDLLLIWAAIRNSGTGTVNTPTGYTALLTSGNVGVYARYATGSDVAPTVSAAGGVAGATMSAQMAAFRNVGRTVHASTAQLNSSAQDIAYPELSIERANCVVLYLGWKADDWTSVTSPGTEIGEPDTTTGDDQGLVWAYSIQTTATSTAAGSFTVTGGAAAISRGAVVALASDVQTATVARAVNGVSKAQTAGTRVLAADPLILAM